MTRRALAIIWICCCLSSCEFDQDEGFFTQTQATYLLFANTSAGTTSITRVSSDYQIISQWENTVLGVSVSDMGFLENEFWVASAEDQAVFKIDPEKNEVERRLALSDIRPHFISVGETYVLVSDSSQNAIAFINKKDNSLVKQTLSYKPGRSLYQSRKFFLQGNETQIHIFREEALAEINQINLRHPIRELQHEHRVSIMVYTEADSLFEAAINLNSNALSATETRVRFQKKRFTPFQRQAFGKELLRNVELEAGQLSVGNVERIDDFELDFFEAKVYLLRSDSLFVYALNDSLTYLAEDLSGQHLRKAYYYRDFIGE